jgi:hypothetical protein
MRLGLTFTGALGVRQKKRGRGSCPLVQPLEPRVLLSVNITSYENENVLTGVNQQETTLLTSNVNTEVFGKQYTVSVDGAVAAEPLVETGVTITAGVNTTAGAAGLHNVVFVATENDSIYAIDTTSGKVLWQRAFTGLGSGADINNTLGASSITAIPAADLGSTQFGRVVGITGTLVIDSTNNCLYVVVETKETIGGSAEWVQRLHAISLSDGTDVCQPFLISATTAGGSNSTGIYVYGTGTGSVVDPYNGTGRQVVQFNALTQLPLGALSLQNGVIYAEWTSSGATGANHGWLVAWNVYSLQSTGFTLQGVFNDTPNGGGGGISEGGGEPAFLNPSTFYFQTGNGTGAENSFDMNGFPLDGNYDNSVLELVLDGTTTATRQGLNGWGFSVYDFFTPYDRTALDNSDTSIGTGAVALIPDPETFPTGNALLAGGEGGKVYLLNPGSMGKFDPNNDDVLNSVPNGMGNNTPPDVLGSAGSFSAPVYYNGNIVWVTGQSGPEDLLNLNTITGAFTIESTPPETNFGQTPGSPFITSDFGFGAIVWQVDRNTGVLRAYDDSNLADELWNSDEEAGGVDALDSTVAYATPTVANGQVFVGTADDLTVYGLLNTSVVASVSAADIKGFSYDRNDLADANSIEVVISGGPTPQTIVADLPSPELSGVLGTSSHDFDYAMPVLSVGTHTVAVYAITASNVRTLITTATVTSQNSLFDEHYYLETYPNVAAAVAAGQFATGYDHYIEFGQFEGYNPSPYWNEAWYLKENPDVAAAVQAGTASSGFMQYYEFGQYENRGGLLYYDNAYYLDNNPDVAAAISAGSLTSGFEHFMLYGQYEGRSPIPYYNNAVYLADNQDIEPFITGEDFSDAFEHYILYGQYESRIASNNFNEQIYLEDNPDVAAAVLAGEFPDGFQHWLEYGQYEGRTAV